MQHEKNKNHKQKKKTGVSDTVARLVASRLGKILLEHFRSIVEDKQKWAKMAEELRLKILATMPVRKRLKKVTGKALSPD